MPVGKASVSLTSNGTTLLNLMSAHPILQNSVGRAETVKRKKKGVTKVLSFVCNALFHGVRVPQLPPLCTGCSIIALTILVTCYFYCIILKRKTQGPCTPKTHLKKRLCWKIERKKKDQSENADKTHSKALASYETYNALSVRSKCYRIRFLLTDIHCTSL